MSQQAASLISAFVRAHHTRGHRNRIFSDPLAYDLLGPAEYSRIGRNIAENIGLLSPDFKGETAEAIGWMMDCRLGPLYLGRAAFAERMLENAVMIGASQYILFGAGLDSFAHRLPLWAMDLGIFEVDHPLFSQDKRQRFEAWGLPSPATLSYVAADLKGYMWPAILVACPGFNPEARSFCNLMGLTFQMSRTHLEIFIERLARILPRGSGIVFDYASRDAHTPDTDYDTGLPHRFHYSEMERLLSNRGFLIYESLEPIDVLVQYFSDYNAAHPHRPMQPPHGMQFCLAVRQ